MGGLNVDAARTILKENFAPWIQELDLAFEEVGDGAVTVRLPNTDRIARVGGIVCGQAMMALADTAMVFAIASRLGEFRDMATLGQSISFFRPAHGADVLCDVRVMKMGRSIVFGEAILRADGKDDPIAQATMTYALAPK